MNAGERVGNRRGERRGSFRDAVDAYERGRPGYPEDAVRWLAGDAARLVDLGAGTGKLTAALVRAGVEVVAVELEAAMVARLQGRVPGALAVSARAEELPLRSGWAECIVVAQAFHWFDNERALREMARVLGDGGRLGLVWNVRDESIDWVSEVVRITGKDNSEATIATLTSRPHFGPFESATFRFVQRLDRAALIAHIRSRSHVAALDEQAQARLAQQVQELCDTHPDLVGRELFDFPYVTRAFRAVKQ